MKATIISLAIVLTISTISACGRNELSRAGAADLLQAHPAMVSLRSQAWLGALQDGIDLDVWDSQWVLSARGSEFFQSVGPGQGLLTAQLAVNIEVTGIAPSTDITEVQFRWTYENTSPELRSLIVSGGTGIATTRRFDDGWRLESVSVGRDKPIPLTAGERAQLSSVFAEIAAGRRARLSSAEQAYAACRNVEGGDVVTGAVLFWLQSHVGAWRLSDLRIGQAGIIASSATGTASIPFAEFRRVGRPDSYTYQPGVQAWVQFYAPGWRGIAFSTAGAADAFYEEIQRARSAWNARCGPAIDAWNMLQREQQYWR